MWLDWLITDKIRRNRDRKSRAKKHFKSTKRIKRKTLVRMLWINRKFKLLQVRKLVVGVGKC